LSILFLVVFLTFLLSGCVEAPTTKYTWDLYASGYVNITFTEGSLLCAGDDTPEVVFASIWEDMGYLWVFQEQDGVTVSYYSESSTNTLEHILPDVPCSVGVEYDCTLIIEC
jgi:hypothetical protein